MVSFATFFPDFRFASSFRTREEADSSIDKEDDDEEDEEDEEEGVEEEGAAVTASTIEGEAEAGKRVTAASEATSLNGVLVTAASFLLEDAFGVFFLGVRAVVHILCVCVCVCVCVFKSLCFFILKK